MLKLVAFDIPLILELTNESDCIKERVHSVDVGVEHDG